MPLQSIGKLIKQHRTAKGVTQKQFAKMLNVSQPYISQTESDRTVLSIEGLYTIAQALDTPIAEFLREEYKVVLYNSEDPSKPFDIDSIPKLAFDQYEEYEEICPECGSRLRAKSLSEGGGVICRNKKCDYWFCY